MLTSTQSITSSVAFRAVSLAFIVCHICVWPFILFVLYCIYVLDYWSFCLFSTITCLPDVLENSALDSASSLQHITVWRQKVLRDERKRDWGEREKRIRESRKHRNKSILSSLPTAVLSSSCLPITHTPHTHTHTVVLRLVCVSNIDGLQ